MIIIETPSGNIISDDKYFKQEPNKYYMPNAKDYYDDKKSKVKKAKVKKEKLTPVKELKQEVYATLCIKDGDNEAVRKLVGYAFFNTDTGKYSSLVARKTWDTIIQALKHDNHGTLSNDWQEFYNQQQASKKIKKSRSVSKRQPKTNNGEITLAGLKQVVYSLLEVSDTQAVKEKCKELALDMSGISLRSKLGWETLRKRVERKLKPTIKDSGIVSIDSNQVTVSKSDKLEPIGCESEKDNSLGSHWTRVRTDVYRKLQTKTENKKQRLAIAAMLNQQIPLMVKANEEEVEEIVEDFNGILEVNGLEEFCYQAS